MIQDETLYFLIEYTTSRYPVIAYNRKKVARIEQRLTLEESIHSSCAFRRYMTSRYPLIYSPLAVV